MDFGAYFERSTPPFPRAALCIRAHFAFVLTDRHAGSFFRGRRAGRNDERIAWFRCFFIVLALFMILRAGSRLKKPEILKHPE